MNDHFKLKATQLYIMENSKKFSKPPSSLNISRKIEGGSGSSASTPSEDYKTPSLERDTIPGFEFGNREGEPEGPAKSLLQKEDTGVNQPVSQSQMAAFPQERTSISARALPKGAKVSRASSQSVAISHTKSPISHVGSGQNLILNGSNVKTGMDLGAVSKHSDQNVIVPLMRSPPSARQMKKASFSALPNQTTWLEETAQRGSSLERDQSKMARDSLLSPSTELSGIRRKLEERRKQIENEKKKMEMQWSKQRQQVGKEAFIQVVTKNHLGSGSQSDLRTAAHIEKPVYNREVSDGELMQVKQQERRSRSPALRSCEVDEGGSVIRLAPSSSARNENVKELKPESFGSGQLLLSKNSANSSNSDKRAASSKEIMADKGVGKVSEGKGSSDAMNTSAGYHSDISEYGTSLDRLNCSLSELQGEIMRLSLQQDQIKSLVGSDLEPALISTKPFSTPPQSSKAQFYLYPRNTTDMTSGTKQPEVSTSTVVSSVNGSAMPSVCTSNSTGLFGLSSTALTSFPGTKTFANPLGFMNPGMSLRGEMYPAGQMNARYANQQNAYALYYPMPHVPYLDGMGYPMRMTNSVCPPVSTFPISQQGSVNYPVQNFNPYAGPWPALGTVDTSGISGDNTATELTEVQQVPSFSAIPRPGATVGEKMSETAIPSKNPEMPSPSPLQCDLQHSGPMNFDLQNFPPTSASLSSPGSCISSTVSSLQAESKSSSIPSSQDEAVPTSAPNEAFFMVLDSDLPRRPKPVLSTSFRKKETLSAVLPDSYSVPADSDLEKPAEELSASNSAPCDAAPSVGFVIGGDESSMNQELQQEVEKKRQKMAEMHQKRREELEFKKQKIEMEQLTKREALRLKQEKNEEKKAREKARREEIFQSYLQRKADEDFSEDDAKIPSHQVGKRPIMSKVKLQRPRSQPPPSSGNSNEEAQGSTTPSSVEGHATDPRTGSPSSLLSRSSERLNILTTNFEQLEARLAFGNIGQRTPLVADRVPRFVSSCSDGSSDVAIGGVQLLDNYAGPKLFVKPSQKSNRHIIVNAIKDCCLAGLVNQDTKNKVVEEINKSESKHFVILFRDAGMQYRGLYTYNPDREDVFKIHGVGPNRLLDKMMERFYKYNSGAKNFSEVTSTKHLSATIDAVTILGTLWQKKPAAGQSKRPN